MPFSITNYTLLHKHRRPTAPPKVASVPVMITNKMRAQLKAMGVTDEQLKTLTPEQAHKILQEKKTD